MPRDDFTLDVKDILARRVGMRCSNPNCRQPTSGPQDDPTRSINVGVAAHITAASEGAPRYNPSLTSEERRSVENGIWLCQVCAKLIDNDPTHYPVDILQRWKTLSEEAARLAIETRQGKSREEQDAERHWGYCEAHEIVNLELAIFTKRGLPVSRFVELIQAVHLNAHPDKNDSIAFETVLDFPQLGPEGVPWRDLARNASEDKCEAWLWALYSPEDSYWWKTTGHEWSSEDAIAAGVDVNIPWRQVAIGAVNSLRDLSIVPCFGISVPWELVELGIEDISLGFSTNTSKFDLDLSIHGLEGLRWLQEQQAQHLPQESWMPLGLTFSGQEILDRLRQQFIDRKLGRTKQIPYRGIMGLTGPNGLGVRFFPNMPKSFMDSDESKQFSFTITIPSNSETIASHS